MAPCPAMDDAERTSLILKKLQDGSLPARKSAVLWGGTGGGVPCAGCEALIHPPQIEFECHAGDVVMHLCRPCFSIWDAHVT